MDANIKEPARLDECRYRDSDVDLHRIFSCGDDLKVMPGVKRGDVARCKHGHIWMIVSGLPLRAIRLRMWDNPIRYRRAKNAIAHSNDPVIEYQGAIKMKKIMEPKKKKKKRSWL